VAVGVTVAENVVASVPQSRGESIAGNIPDQNVSLDTERVRVGIVGVVRDVIVDTFDNFIQESRESVLRIPFYLQITMMPKDIGWKRREQRGERRTFLRIFS
jgi:predicted transcriptional regulator